MVYSFNITGAYLTCKNQRKEIVSDSVSIHSAKFTVDETWNNFDSIKAIFTNSKDKTLSAEQDVTGTLECNIPSLPITKGGNLIVKLVGETSTSKLTTTMTNELAIILASIGDGGEDIEFTPSIVQQLNDKIDDKGDNLTYVDNVLTLRSGEDNLSSVTITSGGSGGGDMYKNVYDPTNVNGDSFDMDNMKDGLVYVRTTNDYTDTEKLKLEGLSNYSLPIASETILGGIKIGDGLEIELDGTLNTVETVTSVNGQTGVVSLDTDDIEPTVTRRYVPSIPLTEPSEKYLNGNGEFVSINVGASGYVSNLYLSTIDSVIVPTYDTLNYEPESTETEQSVSITSAMGEVLVRTYLGLGELDTDIIQSGVWKSRFIAKVSATAGTTTARGEFFVRHINGTETTLFSKMSAELEDTNYAVYATEETRPSYDVEPTDIIGFRLYAQTTRAQSTTITFIVGDGRGAYFNIPLQMRHKQLRDKNEEDAYQHITLEQKNELHTHTNKSALDLVSGTNTGDETNSTIISKIGYTPENIANKNQSLGYCGLDSGGKVPSANLPTTLLKYIGVWDASTNTPTLTNPDTTKVSNVYTVSVDGVQFGISFKVGDWLIYNANGIPEKSDNSDDVTSVNGKTGSVVLTTADIADSLDKRYVTDAQKTIISNTSGTNSGNETATTIGTLINGATAKTTPIDADMVGLMDSANSNILKKLSWLNIKATLKTYFDTLYNNYALTNALLSAILFGATAETTISDDDTMPLTDTSATNSTKKITWANIKATLKTYFDTLYMKIISGSIIADATTLSITLNPNVNYKTATLTTCTSLTIALGTGEWFDEYTLYFTTGTTPPTITLPIGVTWVGGAPTFSANKTYIISIQNGIGVVANV